MAEVDDLLDRVANTRVVKAVEYYGRRSQSVLEMLILILIILMAFFIRLFAVIRFESVIHEFDPHFNWRTTEYLVSSVLSLLSLKSCVFPYFYLYILSSLHTILTK